MKAGGSAGHGLVLSCQGAECRPWAHSRGKSWVEGEGDPLPGPLPSPPLPWNVKKTREREKEAPHSPEVKGEETDVRS